MSVHSTTTKITVASLRKMKKEGERISMLTSYDYTTAKMVDAAGIDVILVGDSAANVMAGYETTLPITLDQMIYHAQSVVRGASHAMVVVDMPFGTFQTGANDAVKAGIRIMKETGAQGVKLEGGKEKEGEIKAILSAGIPVLGHLGLTPQSIHQFGSFALRAKQEQEATKLLKDAKLLEELGCFALVLEKIPALLAKEVTQSLSIPTIGIGAGPSCDGQVLVFQDLVGMNNGFSPKFLRKYLNLYDQITTAVGQYINDVKTGSFPNETESY